MQPRDTLKEQRTLRKPHRPKGSYHPATTTANASNIHKRKICTELVNLFSCISEAICCILSVNYLILFTFITHITYPNYLSINLCIYLTSMITISFQYSFSVLVVYRPTCSVVTTRVFRTTLWSDLYIHKVLKRRMGCFGKIFALFCLRALKS